MISNLPPTMPPFLTDVGERENITMNEKRLKVLILQGLCER
jgi:hypothetical protein